MNHTLDELLDIVYRYYPRGVGSHDQLDDPRIKETEEHARLVAARRRAAADERWHAMRRRISERFPDAPLMNHSLHLPTGALDACYSFTIYLPNATDGRTLWFHVSFLAPYYIIYSSRRIERSWPNGSMSCSFKRLQYLPDRTASARMCSIPSAPRSAAWRARVRVFFACSAERLYSRRARDA